MPVGPVAGLTTISGLLLALPAAFVGLKVLSQDNSGALIVGAMGGLWGAACLAEGFTRRHTDDTSILLGKGAPPSGRDAWRRRSPLRRRRVLGIAAFVSAYGTLYCFLPVLTSGAKWSAVVPLVVWTLLCANTGLLGAWVLARALFGKRLRQLYSAPIVLLGDNLAFRVNAGRSRRRGKAVQSLRAQVMLEDADGRPVRTLACLPLPEGARVLEVSRRPGPFRLTVRGEVVLADGAAKRVIRRSPLYEFAD